MRKAVIAILLCLTMVCAGCAKRNEVENFSEITFYYFEGRTGQDYALLCVGEREEPYKKDGVTAKKFDFSLITLSIEGAPNYILPASIEINGVKEQVYLEMIGNEYTFDLGRKVASTDNIRLSYNDKVIDLQLQVPEIDYAKAISIGEEHLSKVVDNKNHCERYLRVLTHQESGQKFWGYSVFSEAGQEYVAVIDSSSGQVIKG